MNAPVSTQQTVLAELNYLLPTQQRPRSFAFAPPGGAPRSTVVSEPHKLLVHDIRSAGQTFSLDQEGFAVVRHHSGVRDFQDEEQIRQVYYAEAERLLKDVTGADRIYTSFRMKPTNYCVAGCR